MERRYRESEKKIHKSPYVDPGEAAVDLPQDIIRQGGDLVLLRRPVTWSYPDHPEYGTQWGTFSPRGTPLGGPSSVGIGINAARSGGGAGAGGYASGVSSQYGFGGGAGAGGYGGSSGIRSGSVEVGAGGGGGGGGYQSGYSSSYQRGPSSTTSYSATMNANSDYAAPSVPPRQYPTGGAGTPGLISIKRSASQGDSSYSAFTPATADQNATGGGPGAGAGVGGGSSQYQVQKYAGLNAFPVSPADTRLSSWTASPAPGATSTTTTTTTQYRRLYQESLSRKSTANGNVTFNEVQTKQNKEQGQYYS